ncbi:MAG: hypothetical protein VB065_05225, partial [Eubacteriales bacterium]|nr:hypothetical protein [Eubacteriales bacterium]
PHRVQKINRAKLSPYTRFTVDLYTFRFDYFIDTMLWLRYHGYDQVEQRRDPRADGQAGSGGRIFEAPARIEDVPRRERARGHQL